MEINIEQANMIIEFLQKLAGIFISNYLNKL